MFQTLETVTATGMSEVISALTTGVTSAVMFDTLADVIPFVITLIPFSLGLYFLRKLVKGAGTGKVKF